MGNVGDQRNCKSLLGFNPPSEAGFSIEKTIDSVKGITRENQTFLDDLNGPDDSAKSRKSNQRIAHGDGTNQNEEQ